MRFSATRRPGCGSTARRCTCCTIAASISPVRGPLNVSRSPQGRPVIAQAGSSDIGMELAARTADMVFTAQTTVKDGRAFRNEMFDRAIPLRPRTGPFAYLPRTDADRPAKPRPKHGEKYEELRELVDDEVGLRGVARLCGGLDISKYPPDGPLPPLPPSNAARARSR